MKESYYAARSAIRAEMRRNTSMPRRSLLLTFANQEWTHARNSPTHDAVMLALWSLWSLD